ncbi:MAG: division/cell wall cluster transcriptional repressor MraZ [Bacteroidetes bacterium]|nr:division/cell wall cluster transcriptional repressor MraZ [Bacteroidota bacterium]
MFIGEYHYRIDEKGRLAVPAKFRSDLKKQVIITRGIEKCLILYSKKEWEKLAVKLAGLPISKEKNRDFNRLMLGGAMDVEVDSQGRVILPDYLRVYANIKKNVVVVGLYDKLEIWDEEDWEKQKSSSEKESKMIAESLSELGV